ALVTRVRPPREEAPILGAPALRTTEGGARSDASLTRYYWLFTDGWWFVRAGRAPGHRYPRVSGGVSPTSPASRSATSHLRGPKRTVVHVLDHLLSSDRPSNHPRHRS